MPAVEIHENSWYFSKNVVRKNYVLKVNIMENNPNINRYRITT